MLNTIIIMGRLTRDPELKHTEAGDSVVSFTVAVGRDYGKDQTDFIDCVAWKAAAEYISKYFSKGCKVVVTGRLQIRDWTDKDNNKRRSAEVIVGSIYHADSRPEQKEVSSGEELPF